MTLILFLLAVALFLVLGVSTVIQTLYLESLRLRARELPSLEFFRETLEDRLGLKGERGALSFSIVKHTALLLLGVVVLALVARSQPSWRVVLEACLFAWLAMMAAAYAIPQILYRKTSAQWLVPLVPALRLLALIVRPLVFLLSFLQSLSELSENNESTPENGTQAENIDALITAGTEEGLIEEDDRKLIHSVVAFGDKTVHEVMTPRPNIVAIEADRTLEDLRELVIHEQYSRIPVYQENIDNIIGFIHVRDMFELDEEERERRAVRALMRPVRLVPETKAVPDLLREMQEDGAHMVVVVDEYGNTAGLATMEDLVEEVFGEIRDEHEPARDVIQEPGGAYVVSGSFDLDNLADLLAFRPPEVIESTTVGGLATEWLGHVAGVGEVVERDGIRIEVLAGNELRVDRVRISKSEKPSDV